MTPAEYISKQRAVLGLTDTQVAQTAGLSIHEYGDIEQHADEFASAVPLENARRVAEVLHTDIQTILGLRGGPSRRRESRHLLIARRRNELGLTITDVGDSIGFTDEVVRALETVPHHLDTLPINVAIGLSNKLGVPLADLLSRDP